MHLIAKLYRDHNVDKHRGVISGYKNLSPLLHSLTSHQEEMGDEAALIKSTFPNFADEILFLKSAFPTETTLCICDHGINLNIMVTPGVCVFPVNVLLGLDVFCPLEYPLLPPAVKVVGPVGLSDSALSKLQSNIAAVIDSCEKDYVIFPLIECCRYFISSNIPSVDCSICFDAFQTEEEVQRSRCNHFFHKECLSQYHNNLLNTYKNEMAALLAKNPFCPKELQPKLKPLQCKPSKVSFRRVYIGTLLEWI
eukprot:TsM_000200100 transcript=TsM_000200100 gene=TsM_000200100